MIGSSDERPSWSKGADLNITVYCGSTSDGDEAFERAARDLGAWIAAQGHALVYGGSSIGLMGIVSRAVIDAGGAVHGVELRAFAEAGVVQHGLASLQVVDTMAERKARMIELGDVFVALPGGAGTLEEISEIMSRIRMGKSPSVCSFLNVNGFYNPLRQLIGNMLACGFVTQADCDRFLFPESVEEFAAIVANEQRAPHEACATAAELASTPR